MNLTRREFIKTSAVAATAAAEGVTVPGVHEALAATADSSGIRWDGGAASLQHRSPD